MQHMHPSSLRISNVLIKTEEFQKRKSTDTNLLLTENGYSEKMHSDQKTKNSLNEEKTHVVQNKCSHRLESVQLHVQPNNASAQLY